MSDMFKVIGRHSATPSASPSTIVMVINGATKRLWLHELQLGSSNASALAGVEWSLGRPSTQGTGGAAYVPRPVDSSAPAALFTAKTADTTPWSAEPTQPGTYDERLGIDAVTTYIYTPKTPIVVPISGLLAVRIEIDNSATKAQWTCTLTIEE